MLGVPSNRRKRYNHETPARLPADLAGSRESGEIPVGMTTRSPSSTFHSLPALSCLRDMNRTPTCWALSLNAHCREGYETRIAFAANARRNVVVSVHDLFKSVGTLETYQTRGIFSQQGTLAYVFSDHVGGAVACLRHDHPLRSPPSGSTGR
jgi:hypothetical protein